ncbi:MAG: glycosyltransferase [Pedosphaera sp.]|nr:glycosyltransferase [Pedosphaera sp.]
MSGNALIIFVKAPRAGHVKTRLAAAIGAEAACQVYEELVRITCAKVSGTHQAEVELRYTPDDAASEIAPWLRAGWTAQPQGEGALGTRMARAFDATFAAGADKVVLIGSDCPDIEPADIASAFDHLSQHDVVLGPAQDGGYWLIGLRARCPALFANISWSTSSVLASTLQQCAANQLDVVQLRVLADIDTETDWRVFEKRRREAGAADGI